MTHHEIAQQIRKLVAEERFEEAETLLHEYARIVTERCVTAADEAEFQAARAFVKAISDQVKAHKAHYAVRLSDLQRGRLYGSRTSTTGGQFDVLG